MKKLTALICLLIIGLTITAQQNKKPLTFDDILKWNRITEKEISHDGKIVVYKAEPWKGDPVLKITDKTGNELNTIIGGTNASITYDSKYVVFKIKPTEEEIRQLKLADTKKEDLPLDQLGIYSIGNNQMDTIKNQISFKVPSKWAEWIVYQTKTEIVKDTTESKKDEKVKEESSKNGYTLTIHKLSDGSVQTFPFVTDYVLAKEKEAIAFISTGDDKDFQPGIYFYDLNTAERTEVITGKGKYKQLSLSESAKMLAYVADTMEDKKDNFSLYLWKNNETVYELINNKHKSIPEGWEISEHGQISFSEKTNRVFFGMAPEKLEKDTTKLDEEIPALDVWHWNEPTLYTEQLHSVKTDLKKSYLSVYHLSNNNVVQLEKENYSDIRLINNGDAEHLIARSNLPYAVQRMWEGYPEHNDFYLIDINTGKAKMIKKDVRAYPSVSPEGKYVYWYNAMDTSWNTYHIKTGKEFKVTNPKTIQCADEMNDIPNPADDYGIAGWIENDAALLVYDRYDLWKVDPENKKTPVNITLNGRKNKITYRLIDFDNRYRRALGDDIAGIDPNKKQYIHGHNEISRNDGIYEISLKKPQEPNELLEGSFKLNSFTKAGQADAIVYTQETFEQFPNLQITENDFKKSVRISDVNPQQSDFLWGTKELYTWTSLDGRKLEGLLIKPANFDPNKKYPMIVNFYEKSSQGLYNHQIPEAHRSTVDYHYYSSNDYIIFNPDIYYKEGYPGEDAFNCVMPGVTQLISEGYVNEKAIAAQGHSWGGYQVAYLATRTNLFAAIESGAPVVNMFSAYGGIRLWTGRNRSFQYEHTQSRIGKSIWESPLRYLENSPLFTADKIQTPMLIMHNEDDGAVPFSQGIEFFIALRRLGKEAWLLNYNEADHWPTKVRDKYDFQIRMAQFFDHYLKGKPMPKWMEEGIPAVNKGLDLGY